WFLRVPAFMSALRSTLVPYTTLFRSNYIKNILKNREFRRMISDTGILQDSDFLYEVRKRLSAKILPFQPQKETLEYVLNQIFFKDRKSTRLNSSHVKISYAVFCLKTK